MPVILRCAVCDKPVGYADTPCIVSDWEIHLVGGDGMFVDGDFHNEGGRGFWYNHEGCREKSP